jgi:signal transduction protein with GAF and PtsI domain
MGDVQPTVDPQETIRRQAEEIGQLRRQLREADYAQQLRKALVVSATAGTLASPTPHAQLLELIVTTAAHVLRAKAASLFSLDYEKQELVFEVALGDKAEEVKRFRIPVGHGVAGLVAVTGQPMAISDVQHDPHHARDIAQRVGYLPQSLLCVPLFYHDRVIGVLELLDKLDAPSFRPVDIETLGLFANQAAIAFELSRTRHSLHALIRESIPISADGADGASVEDAARSFADSVAEDPGYRQAVELAQLVQDIVSKGEHESNACLAILRDFAAYLQTRPHRSFEQELSF